MNPSVTQCNLVGLQVERKIISLLASVSGTQLKKHPPNGVDVGNAIIFRNPSENDGSGNGLRQSG
mgnify:CR=1 FL=1